MKGAYKTPEERRLYGLAYYRENREAILKKAAEKRALVARTPKVRLTDEEKAERRRAQKRRAYEANRDKARAYYEANRERCLAKVKEWHSKNPDYLKNYAEANRERLKPMIKELQRQRYVKNKEKIRARTDPYSKQYRERLGDGYVLAQLLQGTTLTKADIPSALIELKRLHLQMRRFLKDAKQ